MDCASVSFYRLAFYKALVKLALNAESPVIRRAYSRNATIVRTAVQFARYMSLRSLVPHQAREDRTLVTTGRLPPAPDSALVEHRGTLNLTAKGNELTWRDNVATGQVELEVAALERKTRAVSSGGAWSR